VTFDTFWSSEENKWVGTYSLYPNLSHLDKNPALALSGTRELVRSTVCNEVVAFTTKTKTTLSHPLFPDLTSSSRRFNSARNNFDKKAETFFFDEVLESYNNKNKIKALVFETAIFFGLSPFNFHEYWLPASKTQTFFKFDGDTDGLTWDDFLDSLESVFGTLSAFSRILNIDYF
jgi:hypothetical protein